MKLVRLRLVTESSVEQCNHKPLHDRLSEVDDLDQWTDPKHGRPVNSQLKRILNERWRQLERNLETMPYVADSSKF